MLRITIMVITVSIKRKVAMVEVLAVIVIVYFDNIQLLLLSLS